MPAQRAEVTLSNAPVGDRRVGGAIVTHKTVSWTAPEPQGHQLQEWDTSLKDKQILSPQSFFPFFSLLPLPSLTS